MKVWIEKPKKNSDAPLLAAEHRGMTLFADGRTLAGGVLGLLLALLLPGLFGRSGARRRSAARRASRRSGTFGKKGGTFGGKKRR